MIEIVQPLKGEKYEKEILQWMNDMNIAGSVSSITNKNDYRVLRLWTFANDAEFTMFKLKWGHTLEDEY
jgi:hypothetical protein